MPHTHPLCLGLDVGGSGIKAGLLDADDKVIVSRNVPTPVNSTPRAVLDVLVKLTGEMTAEAGIKSADLAGIGIGFPGLVDARAGVVKACVNLQDWHNIPVTTMLVNRMGANVPVTIANDANAAALGEHRHYHKINPKIEHLALITLGTGVGSGIVLNGRMFEGGTGLAGEVGHMIVRANGRKCACGQYGCLERYASASAIVGRVREMIERGSESLLTFVVDDPSRKLTAENVVTAAREGDALSRRIIDEAAEFLAIGCVNLCRVIDLQAIIIGGGITGAGDLLLKPVLDNFRIQNWSVAEAPMPDIRLTSLGGDAGFVGCAAMARQRFAAGPGTPPQV